MVSERERLILRSAQPALKRALGGRFVQAKRKTRFRPIFRTCEVERLVEAGLLAWVNRCRTAAVVTEDGEREW